MIYVPRTHKICVSRTHSDLVHICTDKHDLYTCIFILQAPPNLHPFVLEGLVRTKTFFPLLLGVAYSFCKSESSSSSEVRSYDHHRWETNKQTRETNTPCVPFDVFLFYHWERSKKLITCVIVVWKNVSPIDFLPVHILQVSFGHCRPLAVSQVTRRKDMELLHKFAQP